MEKVIKKNLRTISKPHAYLQTMTKTSVKFRKNPHKTVGGVAHTRYLLSIHFDSKNAEKMTKFNLRKKVTKNNLRTISKPHAYLSDHDKNICEVSKESAQNCRRSCAHKVPTTLGGRKDGKTDGRTDGRTERTEGRKDGMPKTMSLRFSSKRRGTIS